MKAAAVKLMSTNALILSRDNGLEFDRFNSFNVTIMPMTCKDLEIDAVSFNDIDGNKYTGFAIFVRRHRLPFTFWLHSVQA